MIPFCPAIRRTGEPDLLFSLPMIPWELRSGGIGGSATAAAGISESYVVRRDRIAKVTLRMYEIEVEDFFLALEEIRATSEPFIFLFDQSDEYSAIQVYLHTPVWPAEIDIIRDDFPGVFRVSLELRSVGAAPFTEIWLENEA